MQTILETLVSLKITSHFNGEMRMRSDDFNARINPKAYFVCLASIAVMNMFNINKTKEKKEMIKIKVKYFQK